MNDKITAFVLNQSDYKEADVLMQVASKEYGIISLVGKAGKKLSSKNHFLPMSYSSLRSDCQPHPDVHRNTAVRRFCDEYGYEPETLMRRRNVDMGFCTLFQTCSLDHLHINLRDVPDEVEARFRAIIDREFPAPDYKYPLVKI